MTNAEARFNNSLRPRKPEGSLGRTAQDVHLDSHTAPEPGIIVDGFYIALFSALQHTRCALVACHSEWVTSCSAFSNIHRCSQLTALFGCYTAGATWNCCRLGACSVYSIQPCTTLHCHFIQSHMRTVYVCLAVTCRLHFWQNDRDLLRATAVTRRWNGYRNKSQHRKLTLEKKIFSRCSCRDSNLRPFGHESGASYHWAITAPRFPGWLVILCVTLSENIPFMSVR